jgi:large subunit ribosomal protein L23
VPACEHLAAQQRSGAERVFDLGALACIGALERALPLARGQYRSPCLSDDGVDAFVEAVERAFEVKVLDVNMVPIRGERRRLRNGRWLPPKTGKKAVVTLAPGNTIQLFEGA